MAIGLLCFLTVFAQNQGFKDDARRSVKLWREYGRPRAKTFNEIIQDPPYYNDHFLENLRLSDALALAEKGKFIEAKAKFREAQKTNESVLIYTRWLGKPAKATMESFTAMLIYTHISNQYIGQAPVEKTIRLLKNLQKTNLIKPFREDRRYSSIYKFIAELRVCAVKTGKEGSVDDAIDGVKNISLRRPSELMEAPQSQKVLAFGLSAIEPLVDALESTRLTRTMIFVDEGPPQLIEEHWYVRDLIVEIADHDLGEGNWLTKQLVLEWLDAKRKNRVEEWLMSIVVVKNSANENYGNPSAFEAIVAKYPKLLKKAFQMLADAKADPYSALQCLEKAKISESEKEVLRHLVGH